MQSNPAIGSRWHPKGFTSITSALERDVFEQLHPHFTGGPRSAGILLHQQKVRVVAVQGIHWPVRQILWLVHCWLIHLYNENTDRGRREHVNVEICKYLLTSVAAVFISSIMSVHVQKPWQWAEPLCCGSCSRVQCQWPLHELWRRCWPRSDLSLPGPSVWWCQSESHLSKSTPLENREAVPFVFVWNNSFFCFFFCLFFVHLEAESRGTRSQSLTCVCTEPESCVLDSI